MSLCVNDFSEDDLLLGASASPTTGEGPSSSTSDVAPVSEDYPETATALYSHCNGETTSSSDNNGDVSIERLAVIETPNYVGLVNQAMTCYLNSLVQALYMTPEFRNAIYNWEFDGVNETRNIPYQLQKLFLNLQVLSCSLSFRVV